MESPTNSENSENILRDEENFIQNVSQFFNQEALSDVILNIEDQQFHGHKFVLAKSSDVFRTMLYESCWTQSSMHVVELNESVECQQVFDRFLRYLYTAEIAINVESAVGILCLADKYNVSSLKRLCTMYMVENTKSPKAQNALNWYSWAKALNLGDLIEQCAKTIAWNTELIICRPEWLQMDIDFVKDILQSSDLVVHDENHLFQALSRWLLHESHLANLAENASKLLPLIRFPQMLVPQLYAVENCELWQKEECYSLLHNLVGQAYRFRSLCPMQSLLQVKFDSPFYLPRDFTSLSVDNVRMQNTLRFGIQVDVRTYVGPVPSESQEGDWKITYRKSADTWSLQIYCHETALINGAATIQASLIVYSEEMQVIQVHSSLPFLCARGNHLALSLKVDSPEEAKSMSVIIKPLPAIIVPEEVDTS